MTRSKRARRLARRAYAEKHPTTSERPASQPTAQAAPKRTVKHRPQKPFYAKQEFIYGLYFVATVLAVGLLMYWVFGRQSSATSQASANPTAAASAAASTPTVATSAAAPSPTGASGNPSATKKQYSAPPPMTIDPNKTYIATFETDKGTIKAELYAKDAPKTVNNFVFLAREGFYDGLTFHRVLSGFMAQGGDPTGTGGGGPGYQFADEFSARQHLTGTLSMANSGPNTNGSQFFITFAPQPHLNGKHSVFGQVIEGSDVLQKLTLRDPDQRPSFPGDKMKITIEEK